MYKRKGHEKGEGTRQEVFLCALEVEEKSAHGIFDDDEKTS